MNILQATLGIALVALVFADLVQTTLTVNGGGLLSTRLAQLVWRPLLRIHHRQPSHRLLALAGPTIILVYFIAWFGLLWAGWSLIFASGDASTVHSLSKEAADVSELLYFVGFTIITLGVGDYVPNGDLWQVLTVIASASGFFLVTMVITYVLPVISAVVEKRQLAAHIHGLGQSPTALLERAWSGSDYTELNAHLVLLTPQIHRIEKQHLAYPVLHYFHSLDRRSALPSAVAALDDFISVLQAAASPRQQPSAAVIDPLREAISRLLDTLKEAFIHQHSSDTPPIPALPEQLKGKKAAIAKELHDHVERRRFLLAWLRDDGWDWCEPPGP